MELPTFIKCSDCGNLLNENQNHCSKCNSDKKTIILSFEDTITVRDQIKGKAKDNSRPKKKRLIFDFISGSEQSSNGQWVNKERVIDKIINHYFEEVTDERGNLIHFCSEKLTEHQGHGKAKFKKKE